MLRRQVVTRLLVSAALLASIATSAVGPAFAQVSGDAGNNANAGRANQAVREIRADVPYGKDDASFGVIRETPADILTPGSTPLAVRLQASELPQLGKPFTVSLQVHAYRAAAATQSKIELPAGAEMLEGLTEATMDMAEGETRELTTQVVFKEPGEYAITGRALSTISEDMIYGDMDTLFVTVGKTESMEGFASGNQLELAAGQAEAVAPEVSEAMVESMEAMDAEAPAIVDEPAEEAGPLADQPLPDRPGPGKDALEDNVATPNANVNISICWRLGSDRDGSQPRLRDARLELWDNDNGPDDLLATGFTNYNDGCRTFTVNNADSDEGGTIDVYFRVLLYRSSRYRVTTYGNAIYNCQTNTTNNVAANVNYGLWWCGGGAGNDRSVRIFNDLYRSLRFVREHAVLEGMGGSPGEVWVLWQTGGNDGTYYRFSDGKVHLKDADAASRDTVVHEANHSYMDDIYTGWPISDCPSPHFINGVSGKGCALSEGWTYAIVAAADGNPVYTWPSGASLNLETPTCTTANWDDGGRVEGRVGGVLIDLMDPFDISFGSVSGFGADAYVAACGGDDRAAGMFDAVWDLFYDQDDKVFVTLDGVTDSFSNAWESRAYPRYAPHRVGHLNSIPSFTHD